jgi:hypothetical protein
MDQPRRFENDIEIASETRICFLSDSDLFRISDPCSPDLLCQRIEHGAVPQA